MVLAINRIMLKKNISFTLDLAFGRNYIVLIAFTFQLMNVHSEKKNRFVEM